jgi:predicted AlkP superfamily pyrophosphatase or phosphodiesterase
MPQASPTTSYNASRQNSITNDLKRTMPLRIGCCNTLAPLNGAHRTNQKYCRCFSRRILEAIFTLAININTECGRDVWNLIKHVILIDIVGLEPKHLESEGLLPNLTHIAAGGAFSKIKPVFPAVTCTVQASILSGKYPNEHGIVSNGLYDKDTYEVSFWEQASSLVQTERVWDLIKKKRPFGKTAVLFGQQTMYSNADIVVTPRPLHMADEMIMWCYSKPLGYYEKLRSKFGEFNLASYWGPRASQESSEWIVNASLDTLENNRPDFMFTYIPHVDYSAQKFGKNSNEVQDDLRKADELVGRIVQKVIDLGMMEETLIFIFSEYPFSDVTASVPLNQRLRDVNLLAVRNIHDKEYLDLEFSSAFAMVDHQVAHIFAKRGFEDKTKKAIENIDGVKSVLTLEDKRKLKIDHNSRSGDLIAVSEKDRWFSYGWWYDIQKAPKFTKTVDIHRKPGYDPLELFLDPKTKLISQDTSLIKGSHGLVQDSFEDEGYALCISSRPISNIQKSGISGQDITSADLGRYIINLIVG